MCCVALSFAFSVTALYAGGNPAGSLTPLPRPPVTVLLDFENAHSSVSVQALQKELSRILAPARLEVDLRIKSELPSHAEFNELLIFKMKGHCAMGLPTLKRLTSDSKTLALTYSVNGEMLPFGEVECDRVRSSLERVIGRGNSEHLQAAFGVALARVMAHEVYHMMAKSSRHTKDGVTKPSLSGQELAQDRLSMADSAAEALQNRNSGLLPQQQ